MTTLDLRSRRAERTEQVDYAQDFFGKPAYLTVSGQLEAEMLALALSDVYTFGPTFRAENSITRRHAAEFWMVEPEMAFCDLPAIWRWRRIREVPGAATRSNCRDDLALFQKFVEPKLFEQLHLLVDSDFVHLPYTEAIGSWRSPAGTWSSR